MQRKDMNRKDKTAQMIGQIIQPVDEPASYPVTTDVIEPIAVAQTLKDSCQKTLLQTTLSRELGLNLSMPTVGQSSDISMDFGTKLSADFSSNFVESWDILPQSKGPRYRITKLLSQEIGKRTFLGIEECSQSKVVIKLLLFHPDLAEEEAALDEQRDPLPPYELPAYVPYLESFESSTLLGEGLVLIKSFAEAPLRSSAPRLSASDLSSAVNTLPSYQNRWRSRHASQPQHQSSQLSQNQSSARGSSPVSTATPTVYPQYAYGSMRISATPQKLQVQFPESYVRSGLSPSAVHTTASTETIEMWLLAVLGTVVFVGGVVASTGSIPAGVVVAMLLPVLYRVLVGSPTKRRRIAKLRVTSEPDGRAFISLTSMGRSIRDRNGRINGAPAESQLHGSWLSIKSVKVSPTLVFSSGANPFKAKLSFAFHNKNWHSKTLCIVGSYAEIRWLSHHLAEWGRARGTSPAENRGTPS